nr:SMC-Scp complex subunit ScpB [Coxiella-like endosymbiont]
MGKKPPRYSRALLETLALVAYCQPISRGEIEEVRGVTVSSDIMKKLLDREWIKVEGYRDVPGKPALYVTTKAFLDYFNLKKITDLPPLEEMVDLEEKGTQLAEQLASKEEEDKEEDNEDLRLPKKGAG